MFVLKLITLLALSPSIFAIEKMNEPGEQKKIHVATTFTVIADLVKKIGGENVIIDNLVEANQDPHSFEPKAKHIEIFKKADLIFASGLGFEPWLNQLYRSSGSKAKISIVSWKSKVREGDPHLWNSPYELINYTDAIANRLSEELPHEKKIFLKNSAEVKSRLQVIIKKYKAKFAQIPADRRVILTTHDSTHYLCRDFDIIPLSLLGLSTKEEMRIQELDKMINEVKSKKIRYLLTENTVGDYVTQRLIKKLALKTAGQLYLDGLSDSLGPAQDIYSMLEHNLDTIFSTFQGD